MVPGARLIVLGKQGAGKGTQCIRLSHHYVIPHISTGDMLRAEVKHRTELGEEARTYMDAGELIPDDVVLAMVAKRLDQDDTKERGFVLDGFPRTVTQAEGLRDLLSPVELDLVVNLVVPTGLVLRRLASRRVCLDCGTNYSTSNRPRVDWICDVCSGEVVQREDDTAAAIRRRLDLYETETAPLIAWYRKAGTLASISGVGEPESVSDRIILAIDARRAPGADPLAHQGYEAHEPHPPHHAHDHDHEGHLLTDGEHEHPHEHDPWQHDPDLDDPGAGT